IPRDQQKLRRRCVPWKPSRDFTHPLRILRGLKGLLHKLNATVIPTKLIMLGLKDFKMIVRVTTAQLQLLSDYYCWKDYADRDEIKD
ncbi:hypothetical protein Tco_1034708, partial [Tanacetum coccineum]